MTAVAPTTHTHPSTIARGSTGHRRRTLGAGVALDFSVSDLDLMRLATRGAVALVVFDAVLTAIRFRVAAADRGLAFFAGTPVPSGG